MRSLTESADYLINNWSTYDEMRQVEDQVNDTYLVEVTDRIVTQLEENLPDGWAVEVNDAYIRVYPEAPAFADDNYWTLFARMGPFRLAGLLSPRLEDRIESWIGTELSTKMSADRTELLGLMRACSAELTPPTGYSASGFDNCFIERPCSVEDFPAAAIGDSDAITERGAALFQPAIDYAMQLAAAVVKRNQKAE